MCSTLLRSCAVAAGMLAAGCGAQTPLTTNTTVADASLPASTIQANGVAFSEVASYRILVNPQTLTGEVTPNVRQAATIGDLFFLNIDQFSPPFLLTGVRLDGINNVLLLDYAIDHPFAAPTNPSGPATAANRADLGVAGWVAFETAAVPTPDPSPLSPNYVGNYEFDFGPPIAKKTLNSSRMPYRDDFPDTFDGFLAWSDAWEAQLQASIVEPLVDDFGPDSRINVFDGSPIARGATSAGNLASTNEWSTTAEVTANRVGYTGGGVLHQGQRAVNTLTIPLSSLDPIDFDATVVATYTDPRGGTTSAQKRANRLPSNDPTKFGYKMPHGAVDIEAIGFGPLSGLLAASTGSTITFDLQIVDSDVSATVDPSATAGLDTIPNASGVASVQFASTELGIQETVTLPVPTGSGTYENPLVFAGLTITNTAGSDGGEDSGAWMCIRVVDEQVSAAPGLAQGIALDSSSPPAPDPTHDLEEIFSKYALIFITIG